jgi:ketosteroid isomerase-like protein
MDSLMTTINGSENLTNVENDKLKVLVNFYKAFNQRDLKLMQDVWLNTDEASMNNPVGGIMRGWKNIESVYDKIFNGKAKVYVEFYDFTFHSTENMFLVTGRERGFFEKENLKIDLAIRTSRVFIKENGEWKHIHHHGSIDNPELLKKYQDAILNM